MNDVNTLNAETRLKSIHKETGDRLAALLIAVYKLPIEQRVVVLDQYERNLETMKMERAKEALGIEEETEEGICEKCGGLGYVEIMGDGENFEVDVVDTKPCDVCFSAYEIQP